MTSTPSLKRCRPELGDFLTDRRRRITPEEVGLPSGMRRRTPGLRREEVAALAGVGLTWYTWLEQGRDIRASSAFLDRLASIFKLDAVERRHLFLLAHQRLPSEPGKTWCEVPALVHRLMADLPNRPAYVLNLRWDVLAFNPAADALFGFSHHAPEARNLLWLLFTDAAIRALFDPWAAQARQMLASFKRDAVRAPTDPAIKALVDRLVSVDDDFSAWWREPDIHGPCSGVRTVNVAPLGAVELEHISLVVDESRHLRMVYYAARQPAFDDWLKARRAPAGGLQRA